MKATDERNIDPIEEMNRIAKSFLNLDARGFKESFRSPNLGKIIYDSEWCRLSLIWGGWDYATGNNVHIRYGRLHAPNEQVTMIWKGEECRCWHDFSHALHFLDGRSPFEATKLNYSHSITDPFYKEEFRQQFPSSQPEWLAQMQATIWQHYGTRLFELFDLRRPDLWEQYRQFLKEFYDIKGRNPAIEPPLDKVC
jgi:hypothetical protein